MTPITAIQADELKPWSDEEGLHQLGLLYNHTEDDSRQFTRWQMLVAMHHGRRLSTEHPSTSRDADELRRIVADMDHAIGGGMSWISFDECREFQRRIGSVAERLTPVQNSTGDDHG